jgi:hypothetical protein
MTTEPPQGLKPNMMRIFNNIVDQELYDSADDFNKDTGPMKVHNDLEL